MTSVVYFVQSERSRLIKIGWTGNLERRLSNLRHASGDAVTLLTYCRGGRALEKHLHTLFDRHRRHGEWFQPTTDVVALIERIMAEGTGFLPPDVCKIESNNRPHTREAVSRAADLLKAIAEPAPKGGSVAKAIKRAADRITEATGINIPVSRIEDIWRREARQITSVEMDAISSAQAARPPTIQQLMRDGEALAQKMEAMIAENDLARQRAEGVTP